MMLMEKTGFGGYFAKHHDAYKKMSVLCDQYFHR